MEGKQSGRARRFFTVLLCAAAAAAALWLWESGLLERMNSREEIRAMIEAAGPLAGAVYSFIQLIKQAQEKVKTGLNMVVAVRFALKLRIILIV